jgi:hypothetical protein
MKALCCIVAATALAGSVAGCADPYYNSYPRYGHSQGYYYPSSYNNYYYPSGYSYGPSYAYSNPRYGYRSEWDYYRHYNGIHSGPEMSMAGTVP